MNHLLNAMRPPSTLDFHPGGLRRAGEHLAPTPATTRGDEATDWTGISWID